MDNRNFLNEQAIASNLAKDLKAAYSEISFQIEEKGKRAAELVIANIELSFQNEEKEKRSAELIIANKELIFQNKEKGKRAGELIIANKELIFQNKEKGKRAAELFIANNKLIKSEANFRKLNEELEQKVSKRTSQYVFLSQINQTIVHVRDEATLFRNSCRFALEFGKFKMAWIGSFNSEQNKITLLENSGIPAEDIKLFTDVSYESKDPQGIVFRTGKHFLCNDVENTPEIESWKSFAKKQGIHSCIVLPIHKSGKVFGTFNLYASKLNFFNKEDIALLTEVTGDISFALDLLEKTKRHTQAEELIIKNEKLFRALIEKSTDMETLSTIDGKIFYASPSISKVLGYSLEEFLNTTPSDIIHPDNIPIVFENIQKILQSPGASFTIRHQLKHNNGNYIWCEGTITNMLHEPYVHAIVSNFRDISYKKSIEEQLEFDNNNLNALINNTHDLMWSVDRELNLITSNLPFDIAHKLNFDRAIRKEKNILTIMNAPEMINHFKPLYERAFAGETYLSTFYLDTPVELWTEISFYPIRKGHEIIGTACHSRDITGIKKSEKELKNITDRLLLATYSAKIGIWDWDTKNDILIWDDNMYKIFDTVQNEFNGAFEAWSNTVHPDDLQRTLLDVQTALDGPKNFDSVFRIRWHNNEIRYIEGHAIVLRDEDGKANRMIGVNRDITELKVAEETKEKLINGMAQRNCDLEQFTFMISHNLRGSVANILGCAETLQDDTLTLQERKEFLKGLFESVSGLDIIIKDINSILQLKHKVTEKNELISFSNLVNDIVNSLGLHIDKHNVHINSDFSAVDEILSLKVYMHSIFYNLISNSIKYSKPHEPTHIEIKSYFENGRITLTFNDNGLGIDMKKHGDKVFGLYKRFHSHVEGKGIGLFMVKTQVEALEGKITVSSVLNKGTEFTIVFENRIK
ncbi:PAS domain-containing protein [Confluentibacter flavum]|uniref:histidine kinase n=1 Tax=Confluentibacter flavum TaxID=1909700 RepID=A0A2N3HNC6_9FLAO|nr:PAS domain-containing protein [Confluentibacter flavum]PKQ46445.1 hypothetical protein CSW08_02630 [Confluentibacter flavum]